MNEIFNNIMPLIMYLALACFISLVLTKVSISIMPLLGMVDMPGGRHIHKKATPKGGGIAIYLAFFVMTFAYGILEQPEFIGIRLFFVPATLLMLVGYFDDRYNLPARVKLLGQVAVAVLCWWLGFKINTLLFWHLPEMISLIVTVVWICGFINAFNLIDGLDGLSAGLTIVTTLCMTVWFLFDKNFASACAMLILAGACLGFLRYNFHPAQIFMGDVGSMFIGLTIAVVCMPTSKSVALTAVIVPLLAAGVPIMDVFLAIWRRVVKRLIVKVSGKDDSGGVMAADTNHLHHRILSKVKDTKKTAITIYLIGIGFAVTAIVMMLFRGSAPGIGFVVVLLVFVVLIRRVATIEMWDSAHLIMTGIKRPTQKVLLILFHPVYDLAALVVSIYISMLLLFPDKFDYNLLMYTIAPVSLFILISKNYRIFWLRADSGDYGYLVQVLLLGFIFAFCLDYFFIYVKYNSFFCQSKFSPIFCLSGFVLQSFLFTTFLIVGERLALRHLVFVFLKKIYLQGLPADTHIPNTLIYGGGLFCRLLKSKVAGRIDDSIHNIVGILDDEPALRGQYIYGNKVCGSFDELEDICHKYQVEKIIITIKLADAKLKELKQFSLDHKINLTKFSIDEEPLI